MKALRCVAVLLIVLAAPSCGTVLGHLPAYDPTTYPFFGNGYDEDIVVEVLYANGKGLRAKMPAQYSWGYRDSTIRLRSIRVFHTDGSLAADYRDDHLEEERLRNGSPQNEFWVVYPGGLALIPFQYHKEGQWQVYIRSLR
jgi:hypothetical protein